MCKNTLAEGGTVTPRRTRELVLEKRCFAASRTLVCRSGLPGALETRVRGARSYALIAAISDLFPTMFMTRVRL